MTSSSTLQKKPHPKQSISSPIGAIDFCLADATVFLAPYIVRGARRRRPSDTSKQPSRSHPLSTGSITYFGPASHWRNCLSATTGSITHTLTSNAPSHMRPTAHTDWVTRRGCRPGFGMSDGCSKKRTLRLCALSRFTKRSGSQRVWRGADLSSGRSKGPLANWISVSSWKWCNFLHLLTSRSQLRCRTPSHKFIRTRISTNNQPPS